MGRKARFAFLIGFGLAMGISQTGFSQGLYAPAPGADLDRLTRRFSESIRDLADDIEAGLGQSPAGQYLARDARELQRSTNEWYGTLQGNNDPYQIRRSFSGLENAWHRLSGQLSAPGVATPAIADEIGRVEQIDAQLHQALNLNSSPPNFYGAPAPTVAPNGQDEIRRLAYALAQRGEALASVVQASYGGNPNFVGLVNDSVQVARMVNDFNDALGNPQVAQQPDFARLTFATIVQKSNGLGLQLGGTSMPPPVQQSWDAYTSVHNLLRSRFGLTNQTPDGLPPANLQVGIPYNPNPTASVGQWADNLDRQVDELYANFAPTARVVPEGGEMLAEIERLRNDVQTFRRDASQGLDPGRLAYGFREVDADWQRLARRFNRVAQGRTGPNIQRVQQIGQTCQQIHTVLGMPGYPPTIQPY